MLVLLQNTRAMPIPCWWRALQPGLLGAYMGSTLQFPEMDHISPEIGWRGNIRGSDGKPDFRGKTITNKLYCFLCATVNDLQRLYFWTIHWGTLFIKEIPFWFFKRIIGAQCWIKGELPPGSHDNSKRLELTWDQVDCLRQEWSCTSTERNTFTAWQGIN